MTGSKSHIDETVTFCCTAVFTFSMRRSNPGGGDFKVIESEAKLITSNLGCVGRDDGGGGDKSKSSNLTSQNFFSKLGGKIGWVL